MHGQPQGRCGSPAGLCKLKPERPQLHPISSTVVSEWDDHEATTISDVVFLLWRDAGWTVQLVGRYHNILHHDHGTWRFQARPPSCPTVRPRGLNDRD